MAFTVLINSLNFMSLIFYCFIDFTIENYIIYIEKKIRHRKIKKMLHSHIIRNTFASLRNRLGE